VEIYTILPAAAVHNGVGTGATLVMVIDSDPDRGCWLAMRGPDGQAERITINGEHVRAPAGWSVGAERV
jgi:hypothetical protein